MFGAIANANIASTSAYFVGDKELENNPTMVGEAVAALFDSYQHARQLSQGDFPPLIINTCGWTKG